MGPHPLLAFVKPRRPTTTLTSLRDRARALRREISALHVAARDPRTPRLVRLLALAIVAYAVSPIDLIPDPIPVLGYIDDVILLPLAILAIRRAIPPHVLAEARTTTCEPGSTRLGRRAAIVVACIWGATIAAATTAAWRWAT